MTRTIHILNGDSTKFTLEKSDLQGTIIVWREMLCDGSLDKDVGSDEFWMQRYDFFEKELKLDKLEYYDKTIKELIVIEDLSNYDEVILWFEYDLFCQVNLMALCSFLLKYYKKDISYYLICTGKEKGRDGWQTLADYSPNEYQNLYENKTKLSRNDLVFAEQCWNVYVENDFHKIKEFNFNKSLKFKYLQTVMNQHLKRFSNTQGLNEIAIQTLKIIDSTVLKEKNIVKELLLWQQKETVYGFGELQYFIQLKKLEHFYEIKNDNYYLNQKGKKILKDFHFCGK